MQVENWNLHSRAWSTSCHAYSPLSSLTVCEWAALTQLRMRKDEDKAPKDASAGSRSSVAGWQARQVCVRVGVCVGAYSSVCMCACACVCVYAVLSVLMTCFVLARAPEKVKWTNRKRKIHLHNTLTVTHTLTHTHFKHSPTTIHIHTSSHTACKWHTLPIMALQHGKA